MCQSGFQHRDININNVLMLDTRIPMAKLQYVQTDQPDVEVALENIPNIKELVDELTALIKDLGISEECSGFVIDGDMAIDLKEYFQSSHDGSRSVSESMFYIFFFRTDRKLGTGNS